MKIIWWLRGFGGGHREVLMPDKSFQAANPASSDLTAQRTVATNTAGNLQDTNDLLSMSFKLKTLGAPAPL